MAADCGCGGTCPTCSYWGGIMVSAHVEEITKAAEQVESVEPKNDKEKKEKTD